LAALDTNILIDLGNPRRPGHAKAVAVAADVLRRSEALCTTRFNVAELRVGLERAVNRAAEEQRIARALVNLRILEFDEAAAEQFGRIQAHLFSLGQPVGDMDVLIAAVCIVHGQSLITRNQKHFIGIPGLTVEPY
jgi:predicted nucleic acid-binding protein